MATADQIMAEMGDMKRRLDLQETELRGFRQRGGGQSNTGLGDNGKPPVFSGDKRMAFNDWNFKFKSFMGNISAPLMQSMSSIEHRQDVLETSGYTEEQSQMAAGLYYQLTMYTEGTPLGVVRKVTSHDGFEAYRRLAYQYNPQTLGGQLAKLMRIVEFDFGEDGVFLDRMATFEVLIEEYQVAGKEVVSDNLRCAILVTRAPVALRNHLLLNASRDLNWTDVKRSAMDFLLATTFNPVPMDIGHVKGGKPYGGGKHEGKGRGKDDQ